MSGQDFVRAARGSDAAELARIQVESWRADYAGLIPDAVLAELTSAEAAERWQQRWAEAIAKPPTSRHRVLVATAAEPPAGGEAGRPQRVVAGFAAAGPASDEDKWPATDGELYELHVARDRTGQGHGGRLLNAVADTLAEDRFTHLSAWVLEADAGLREFLESAGWAADGARSQLDMGTRVPIVRLHTALEVPEA
ncbi:MAG: GNAT family N-acetyltransferase [Actinobacteria bacterium]|nr:GNAT family N-acetyltransferase [Actinomycetota bacterium]